VLRSTTDLRPEPLPTLLEREEGPGELDYWEIGGDYEYLAASGARFKVLFISNEANQSSTRERFQIFDDGTEEKNLFLDIASVTQERIIRGSYTFDILGNQDVEFGIERAQTILDSKLDYQFEDVAGIDTALRNLRNQPIR